MEVLKYFYAKCIFSLNLILLPKHVSLVLEEKNALIFVTKF